MSYWPIHSRRIVCCSGRLSHLFPGCAGGRTRVRSITTTGTRYYGETSVNNGHFFSLMLVSVSNCSVQQYRGDQSSPCPTGIRMLDESARNEESRF